MRKKRENKGNGTHYLYNIGGNVTEAGGGGGQPGGAENEEASGGCRDARRQREDENRSLAAPAHTSQSSHPKTQMRTSIPNIYSIVFYIFDKMSVAACLKI